MILIVWLSLIGGVQCTVFLVNALSRAYVVHSQKKMTTTLRWQGQLWFCRYVVFYNV